MTVGDLAGTGVRGVSVDLRFDGDATPRPIA